MEGSPFARIHNKDTGPQEPKLRGETIPGLMRSYSANSEEEAARKWIDERAQEAREASYGMSETNTEDKLPLGEDAALVDKWAQNLVGIRDDFKQAA